MRTLLILLQVVPHTHFLMSHVIIFATMPKPLGCNYFFQLVIKLSILLTGKACGYKNPKRNVAYKAYLFKLNCCFISHSRVSINIHLLYSNQFLIIHHIDTIQGLLTLQPFFHIKCLYPFRSGFKLIYSLTYIASF